MKVAVSFESRQVGPDGLVKKLRVFPRIIDAEGSEDLRKKVELLERERSAKNRGYVRLKQNYAIPMVFAQLESLYGQLVLGRRFEMKKGKILTDVAGRFGYDLTGTYSKN